MQQDLLAVAANDSADRFHSSVTIAFAIAWPAFVHMSTPQAVRAMIAVAASRNRGADELLAMHASERLVGFVAWGACQPISVSSRW